jgi:hypothetical protein
MKKYLFLSLFFSAVMATTSNAQNASSGPTASAQPAKVADASAVLQQMKDQFKTPMMEKTGLTEAQADRVIELNFEMRQAAGAIAPDDAERGKKIGELKAAKEKKMNELLTAEQIQSVKTFYEEYAKTMKKG